MEEHPDRFKPLADIRVIGTRGGNPCWLEPEDDPSFYGLIKLPPHAESFGDDGKRPPIYARVVAMGPGRDLGEGRRLEPACKVGDRVLVGAYEGHKMEWRGRKFIVAYDVAIHAVVEPEPEP